MDVMAPHANLGQATLACLKFLAQRLLIVAANLIARDSIQGRQVKVWMSSARHSRVSDEID